MGYSSPIPAQRNNSINSSSHFPNKRTEQGPIAAVHEDSHHVRVLGVHIAAPKLTSTHVPIIASQAVGGHANLQQVDEQLMSAK